jgi:hypothetical protein
MAGADLEHDEHADPAHGHRAVDREEIACQHRGSLERRNCRHVVRLRCGAGGTPQPFQDPPHRRAADPKPEARQLALDPPLAPAGVLPRHLPGQHHEPGVGWQPSCPGEDRPANSGPAAGASAAACLASRACSSAATWGAARPEQRVPRGLPRPVLAWGSAAAAPRPRGAAPATRHPPAPPNAPAAPSSQSGTRRSGRASVLSQAADTASPGMTAAVVFAGQQPRPRFGTPQGGQIRAGAGRLSSHTPSKSARLDRV